MGVCSKNKMHMSKIILANELGQFQMGSIFNNTALHNPWNIIHTLIREAKISAGCSDF